MILPHPTSPLAFFVRPRSPLRSLIFFLIFCRGKKLVIPESKLWMRKDSSDNALKIQVHLSNMLLLLTLNRMKKELLSVV